MFSVLNSHGENENWSMVESNAHDCLCLPPQEEGKGEQPYDQEQEYCCRVELRYDADIQVSYNVESAVTIGE